MAELAGIIRTPNEPILVRESMEAETGYLFEIAKWNGLTLFAVDDHGVIFPPLGQVSPGQVGSILWTNESGIAAWSDPLKIRTTDMGRLLWGDGTSLDTSLERSGPNDLTLSGRLQLQSLVSFGSITADFSNAGGRLWLGSAGDTSLYRLGVGQLKTDGMFLAVTDLLARHGLVSQVLIGDIGTGAAGWRLGQTGDVNLYRGGADLLQTDDSFLVTGNLTVLGSLTAVLPPAPPHATTHQSGGADPLTISLIPGVLSDGQIPDTIARDSEVTAAVNSGVSSGIAAHEAAADPHTGYQKETDKGAANGYAPLDASSLVPAVHLPAAAGSGLPADTVVVAGTRIISNKLLAGDSQPSWRLLGSGRQEWGVGGATAPDTYFYREAASRLRTNGGLYTGDTIIAGVGSAGQVLLGGLFSPATIVFGLSADVNLYRDAADVLATDDQFWIKGAAGLKFPDGTTMITAAAGGTGHTIADEGVALAARATLDFAGAGVTATDTGSKTLVTIPGGGGGLPADTVVDAATRIISNKLLVGDSQPVWRVMGNGSQEWGAGGAAALDTALYRVAANALKASGQFQAVGDVLSFQDVYSRYATAGQITLAGATTPTIYFGSAFDTNLYRAAAGTLKTDSSLYGFRLRLNSGALDIWDNGTIYFGTASDTNLYRFSPGFLKADGGLLAGNAVYVDHSGGGYKLFFGATADTNLYRSAANTLKTDDALYTAVDFAANVGATNQVAIGTDGKLYFGLAADTNLYRSSAENLMTNGSFYVARSIVVDNNGTQNRVWFGNAFDTSLYRVAAAVLGTNGAFTISSGSQYVEAGVDRLGGGQAQINFGAAVDVNLYRAAADVLATDDRLQLAGTQSGSSAGSAIQIGVALPTYLQGYVGGSVHGIFSHNAYFGAADGWHWGTTHASFGSRIMLFNYGTGIEFYADGVATTAGASFVPSNRFTIYNAGGVRSWSQTESGSFLWLYGADANTARIYFNSAMDTNLYRSAAGKLKTDGEFIAAGLVTGLSGLVVGNFYDAVFTRTATAQVKLGGGGPQQQLIIGGATYANIASGDVGLLMGNVTQAPLFSPVGGGLLFVEAGALKYKGSSGTVTQLAPA